MNAPFPTRNPPRPFTQAAHAGRSRFTQQGVLATLTRPDGSVRATSVFVGPHPFERAVEWAASWEEGIKLSTVPVDADVIYERDPSE